MKDQELDQLLKSLRTENPAVADISRWKTAVAKISAHPRSRWVELVAAMVVGLIIGGTFFSKPPASNEENFSETATIEYVVTKSE